MDNSPRLICEEVRKTTSSVLISFSGGKDSFVLLDICSKHFERVEAFFLFVIDNLSFQNRLIDFAEKKYKIKIKKYPHPLLSNYLRNGVCTYEAFENKSYKWGDIENLAREKSGIEWIAAGWKKSDSLQRRGALSGYEMEAINRKSKKFYPLTSWNDPIIIKYMKINKLPYVKTSVNGQFEVELSYKKLNFIKEKYPEDYEKIKEQFPFCETIIKRKELYD